ncbi:MAG TPA: EF-hand domain-containing protein [Pirellulales bacterium]|jgi:Ca2+-binding EF-hand superfamily protein|nr:EF-hand domain-containing protein [Pirellulales bacterium]
MYRAWLLLVVGCVCSLSVEAAWADDLAGKGGEPDAQGRQENTELFDRLDGDHDGQLSRGEIPTDKHTLFDRLLSSADADDNGLLSRQEFAAGLESRRPKRAPDEKLRADFGGVPQPAAVDEMFRKLDRNQDAKVVADEVPDELRSRFDRLAAMADKDNDGAITREELRQGFDRIRQQFAGKPGERDPARVFEYLDRNADGRLTADEIPSERKAMFERAVRFGDRDGDGALTEEEFTKVVAAGRQRQQSAESEADTPAIDPPTKKSSRASRRTDWLSRLDAGHDGKVSLAEYSVPDKKRFARIDTNQDGYLDRDEIQQFAAARAAKMGNTESADGKKMSGP